MGTVADKKKDLLVLLLVLDLDFLPGLAVLVAVSGVVLLAAVVSAEVLVDLVLVDPNFRLDNLELGSGDAELSLGHGDFGLADRDVGLLDFDLTLNGLNLRLPNVNLGLINVDFGLSNHEVDAAGSNIGLRNVDGSIADCDVGLNNQ